MTDLAGAWRGEAAILKRRGADAQARLLEACADELEAWLTARRVEALTLSAAAAESGLSYSALEKAVREGRVPNAGTHGRPRIRRQDLPRKLPARAAPDLVDRIGIRR